MFHFADETTISVLDCIDMQEVEEALFEQVKWENVTSEDNDKENGIWEEITSPEINLNIKPIQEAEIKINETEEVKEEIFEHVEWLNVTEEESWAEIVDREIPLEDISVSEIARNLQWADHNITSMV